MKASTIVKLGPCGGTAGDSKYMNCDGINRIAKISISHGAGICSFTAHYIRNGREESTGQWGNYYGSDISEFELQPNEYIISVKGHYSNWREWIIVRSLKFVTNMRTFGPYGQEEGIAFELTATSGRIVGFHVISGKHIEALGVYVKVPTKFKKLGPCGGGGGAEKYMDCDGISRIVKITVHHGGTIDSVTALTVRFLRNGREESTEQWGGKGANATEVKFHFLSNERNELSK
ncbi:hypothetical protein LUZ61_013924 [Rhynchospora tenuis]|uniref:Jacalin-type lectin domain-containing protein n=1 Tax=Rhynchospora tenuis TaxID=198213 RepID=A0AAD5W9N6_9POAL|nr:hypothetical protein LUZ61_013924 [Rhynchospora tenuis]